MVAGPLILTWRCWLSTKQSSILELVLIWASFLDTGGFFLYDNALKRKRGGRVAA